MFSFGSSSEFGHLGNLLPNMPILGVFQFRKNKDIICQKYGQIGIQLPGWVENIVGKEEIAFMSTFSFSHNVFISCPVLMHQNEYL